MDPPPEWGQSQPKLSIYLQSVERKTNIWGGLTRVGGLAPSFSGWGGSGHFSCKISFTLQNTFSSYFRYKISKKFSLRRTTLTFQTLHFHKIFGCVALFIFSYTISIAQNVWGGANFSGGASDPCPNPAKIPNQSHIWRIQDPPDTF